MHMYIHRILCVASSVAGLFFSPLYSVGCALLAWPLFFGFTTFQSFPIKNTIHTTTIRYGEAPATAHTLLGNFRNFGFEKFRKYPFASTFLLESCRQSSVRRWAWHFKLRHCGDFTDVNWRFYWQSDINEFSWKKHSLRSCSKSVVGARIHT